MPEQLELLPQLRPEQLALDLWAPDMRRQLHEPPSTVRYWAHATGRAAFYLATLVGGILTALFLLGYIKP